MAGDFEVVGVARLASSGRSLKLELHMPYTQFMDIAYISIKDIREVLDKHKKNCTVYMLKDKE